MPARPTQRASSRPGRAESPAARCIARDRGAASSPRAPGWWHPAGRPRRGAELVRELGDHVRFIAADVTRPEQIDTLVDETVAWRGRLDVLFNNAGEKPGAGVAARARPGDAARRDRHAVHQRRACHAQGGARHARARWRHPQLQQHRCAPRGFAVRGVQRAQGGRQPLHALRGAGTGRAPDPRQCDLAGASSRRSS